MPEALCRLNQPLLRDFDVTARHRPALVDAEDDVDRERVVRRFDVEVDGAGEPVAAHLDRVLLRIR
ncbi:hypothetical protein [Haloarcula regularis]|uniref:hypothetical protein n=1 Tax=Haloarcula regularis TaxID=3033392 RepID=UPI0023E8A2A2|nr:hypothetical protein [Halomicroarcula sp. SYNS111]